MDLIQNSLIPVQIRGEIPGANGVGRVSFVWSHEISVILEKSSSLYSPSKEKESSRNLAHDLMIFTRWKTQEEKGFH